MCPNHGAPEVHVAARSMGAGIAFELLRREPGAIDRLALVAPATNWRRIIRHGVKRIGLPGFLPPLVTGAMGSPITLTVEALRRLPHERRHNEGHIMTDSHEERELLFDSFDQVGIDIRPSGRSLPVRPAGNHAGSRDRD